jgi:hypothetical protein
MRVNACMAPVTPETKKNAMKEIQFGIGIEGAGKRVNDTYKVPY